MGVLNLKNLQAEQKQSHRLLVSAAVQQLSEAATHAAAVELLALPIK
jgi:hypothetical protein